MFIAILRQSVRRIPSLMGLVLAAVAGALIQAGPAEAVSITFTTSPTNGLICNNPRCTVTDSSLGDTLTFNETQLGGIWSASGTVIVNALSSGLGITVSNLILRGTSPELGASFTISSGPTEIASSASATGFASLSGIAPAPGLAPQSLSDTARLPVGSFPGTLLGSNMARPNPFTLAPEPFSLVNTQAVPPFVSTPVLLTLGASGTWNLAPVLATGGVCLSNSPSCIGFVVPEPSSLVILAIGIIGAACVSRRGRNRA